MDKINTFIFKNLTIEEVAEIIKIGKVIFMSHTDVEKERAEAVKISNDLTELMRSK